MLLFTTIYHRTRRNLGLTVNEYCILDSIYQLSVSPESKHKGWCYMSRGSMAKEFGVSRQSIINIINKLIKKGFVIKNDTTNFLKTTSKWNKSYFEARQNGGKVDLTEQGVKKVYTQKSTTVCKESLQGCKESLQTGCKESLQQGVKKVDTIYIIDNNSKDIYNNKDKSFVEKLDNPSKNEIPNLEILKKESELKIQKKENHPPVAVAPLKENATSELEAMKAKLATMKAENEELRKKAVLSSENIGNGQTDEEVLQSVAKGKKTTKKSKRSTATDEVIDYLNEKAGTRYRKDTSKTVSSVAARIDEYGVDVLKAIIDAKCQEWIGSNMQMYLRPDTLFNKTKCEMYANNLIQVQNVPIQQQKPKVINESVFSEEGFQDILEQLAASPFQMSRV